MAYRITADHRDGSGIDVNSLASSHIHSRPTLDPTLSLIGTSSAVTIKDGILQALLQLPRGAISLCSHLPAFGLCTFVHLGVTIPATRKEVSALYTVRWDQLHFSDIEEFLFLSQPRRYA